MRLAIALCAAIAMTAPAFAGARKTAGPDLDPRIVEQALAQIGLHRGAVKPVGAETYRLEDYSVRASGKWIVIRMLPRRVIPVLPPG